MGTATITALFGVGGIVLGALVTGGIQMLAGWQNRRFERKKSSESVRRVEYVAVIQAIQEIRHAIRQFMGSNSGRVEPGPDATEGEQEEAAERDRLSAEALDALGRSRREMADLSARIAALGSSPVRDALAALQTHLDAYVQAEIHRIRTIGRYIHAESSKALATYDKLEEALVQAIRVDLDVKD